MAFGDVAPARVEGTEPGGRSTTRRPASLQLVWIRGVHGLPHKGPHAHVPARSLAAEPRMLGIGQADRNATHLRTVPHWLTLISVLVSGVRAGSYPRSITSPLPARFVDYLWPRFGMAGSRIPARRSDMAALNVRPFRASQANTGTSRSGHSCSE